MGSERGICDRSHHMSVVITSHRSFEQQLNAKSPGRLVNIKAWHILLQKTSSQQQQLPTSNFQLPASSFQLPASTSYFSTHFPNTITTTPNLSQWPLPISLILSPPLSRKSLSWSTKSVVISSGLEQKSPLNSSPSRFSLPKTTF
jgi:hypothetical protein